MSYILDALRKSEHERRMREIPTLSPLPNAPQPPPRYPRWLWPVILLLSLNLAALLFWFGYQNATQPEPEMQSSESKPIPITHPPEQKPRQAIVNPPIPSIANKKTDPVEKTATQTHSIADLVPPAAQPKPAPLPAKPQPKPKARKPAVIQPPIIKPVLVKKAEETAQPVKRPIPAPAQKQTNTLPYLHTLSQDFQDRVPAIKMNIHMYSDDAKESFAIINMTKYRTGEIINEGLKLVEITSNGLVLSFDGKTFQIGYR